jgi:hypothetical protein
MVRRHLRRAKERSYTQMAQVARRTIVLAGAGAIWAAAFFAISYGFVRLVEAAVEGDTSECSNADCGFLGRIQTDHDLLAVIVFAALAALPAGIFLWRTWPRRASALNGAGHHRLAAAEDAAQERCST